MARHTAGGNGRLGQVLLFDSSVLLDVFTRDPTHYDWSSAQLKKAIDDGTAAINQIVHTEVLGGFLTEEELDAAFPPDQVDRLDLPWPASFPTARAFKEYRRRGGTKRSPMPDFYIGGHAESAGLAVVTRDPRRIREYFPSVPLIAPAGM